MEARRLRGLWPLLAASYACAAPVHPAAAPSAEPGVPATRPTGAARPPLAVVVRDGDPRGALALAVVTESIADDRGAMVGVALAALVAGRLSARGIDATAVGGWSGWRLRALVETPAEAAALVDAVRTALLTPVAPGEPALAAVARKTAALQRRPLPAEALAETARCTGDAYAAPGSAPPTPAELEAWRAAAHGLGRIALASAGAASLADATAAAIARSAPWPAARPLAPAPWPQPDAPPAIYDASGELPPGGARIVVTAWTSTPERAVLAAPGVGGARGPLASRLEALDSPARLRSVVATAHPDGGCLAATVDLPPEALGADVPSRIATAATLTAQEVAVELADVSGRSDARDPVGVATDPRDAAERAAWWHLAGPRRGTAPNEVRVELSVGVAPPRDAATGGAVATDLRGPGVAVPPEAIRGAIDRATLAWHVPVVEVRSAIERGQGEAWILLASPCGTAAEGASDAGLGAAVALESAFAARDGAGGDAYAEPFVAPDGLGVLVHGRARGGESPPAQARRLADLAARAFAADAVDPDRAASTRARLLLDASRPDARIHEALARALSPAHPSWLDPMGTLLGAGSASNEAIALRASALRAGPLRVAVLANVDAVQAEAAARAVDRWIARRPGEARACPAPTAPPGARAGMYTVDRPGAGPSEAWLALPLALEDAASRPAAESIAAALDGSEGLLARSLGPPRPDAPEPGLARSWSASIVGVPRAPALVVRIAADDDRLDGAVAEIRGLLQRLQRDGLRDDDRTRAAASLARERLAASLDPRARAVALWRGDVGSPSPSADAVRAFASAALRDEALVVVAARPRRPEPSSSKR
jgi:hypothetical protein